MHELLAPLIHGEDPGISLLLRREKLSDEEKSRLIRVCRDVSLEFTNLYTSLTPVKWNDQIANIHNISEQYSDLISDDPPKIKVILSSLLRMFGNMPKYYIETDTQIDETRDSNSKSSIEPFLHSADWQADAIRSLFTLSGIKIDRNNDQTLLDIFFSISKNAYLNYPSGDSYNREKKLGMMLSGLFGPVAFSRVLYSSGYTIWLPTPNIDVRSGIDLIYGKAEENTLPSTIYFSQVKSGSQNNESITISANPVGLYSDEQRSWEKLVRFTNNTNMLERYNNAGIAFSPVWCNICHTGIHDPESWTSTIQYLEEENGMQ